MTQTQINDFWEKERIFALECQYADAWELVRGEDSHESDECEDCDETEIGDAPEYEEENE